MKKNVLITGGSRGIGAALVKRFSSEDWNVVFLYKDSLDAAARLETETGATKWHCDVSSDSQVVEAMEYFYASDAHIDCLINNAGITLNKMLIDMSDAEIDSIVHVNMVAPIKLTRRVLRTYTDTSLPQVIVNIGSVQGRTGAACESVYACTKSALSNFTNSMSQEYAGTLTSFVCSELGWVDTDMTKEYSDAERKAFLDSHLEVKHQSADEVAEEIYNRVTDEISNLIIK